LFVPGKDYTTVCIERIHSHIHEGLKDLIQTDIAKDSFICLIKRLNLLVRISSALVRSERDVPVVGSDPGSFLSAGEYSLYRRRARPNQGRCESPMSARTGNDRYTDSDRYLVPTPSLFAAFNNNEYSPRAGWYNARPFCAEVMPVRVKSSSMYAYSFLLAYRNSGLQTRIRLILDHCRVNCLWFQCSAGHNRLVILRE